MILDTTRICDDAEYRNEIRHRCITDHFFLAELMGFKEFNRRIHGPVFEELYFPKNPKVTIAEQHPIKNRLHLDPRGTFKTTAGRVDSLQWILAFPEKITILNETATQELAKAISEGIATYFYRPKDRPATLLQLIFDELVVDKKPNGTWNTPVHDISDIDSTIAFTSPQSAQSGWHPWLECIDDMVETKNSGLHASQEIRQAVIDTYYTNKNTLRHGGYINLRGTRYHPFELYGDVLDKMDPEMWKVLIRGALTVKSGARLMPGEFPDEDDIIIHFPELPGMDYRGLREKFFDNYESFMCQQQNDPQGGSVPTFDESLYKTMLAAPERISALGDTFICWRLPYAGKPYMAKYAEGAAARIFDGKVYIIDAWQGIYTPSRLAEKIVRECRHHQVDSVMMEELPGIEYIEAHIRNEAVRRNIGCHISWLPFQEDDNNRMERIRNLEPQARAGRIAISTAIGAATELRRQILNFGLVVENGILDCVSRLASRIPISLLRSEIDEEEKELQIQRRHQMMSHFVYGMQQEGVNELERRRQQEQEASAAAMARVDSFGLTDILGGLDG